MRILFVAVICLLGFSFYTGAHYLPLPKKMYYAINMNGVENIDTLPDTQAYKDYYSSYLISPEYRKRLQNYKYKSLDKTIIARLLQLNEIHVVASTLEFTLFSAKGDYININWLQMFDDTISISSALAHECAHGAGALGKHNTESRDIQMTSREENDFRARNVLTFLMHYTSATDPSYLDFQHDMQPAESKADLYTLRYMLYRDGIYDVRIDLFTEDMLNKSKLLYKSDKLISRMFRYFSDEDVIYLMNHIA